VPLSRAFLEVSGAPVMATGRSKDELWAAVHKTWTDLMAEKGPLRVKRNVSALEKQFKKIRKGVSTFTSHYLAVKNMQTTGNLLEEDIISGAIARSCSLDIYEAIRKDREQDKRKGRHGRSARRHHLGCPPCRGHAAQPGCPPRERAAQPGRPPRAGAAQPMRPPRERATQRGCPPCPGGDTQARRLPQESTSQPGSPPCPGVPPTEAARRAGARLLPRLPAARGCGAPPDFPPCRERAAQPGRPPRERAA